MPAYKEKRKLKSDAWTVKFKYKNLDGEIKWITKRGFKTKKDALAYEANFKLAIARENNELTSIRLTYSELETLKDVLRFQRRRSNDNMYRAENKNNKDDYEYWKNDRDNISNIIKRNNL